MKYWTYMKGEVPGSYEPAALAALPGFTMTTLVCPGLIVTGNTVGVEAEGPMAQAFPS